MSTLADRLARLPPDKREELYTQLRGSQVGGDPPLVRNRAGEPVPASYQQEQLWFIENLEPGETRNNLAVLFHLRGALDANCLSLALQRLVDRHSALRTSFAEVGGAPIQVVASTVSVVLRRADLTSVEPVKRATALQEFARAEAARGFSLDEAPLLRTVLVQMGDGYHALVWVTHHIVSDAWSLDILIEELGAFYTAAIRGEDRGLPELPVDYTDFAIWQRARLDSSRRSGLERFWKDTLHDSTPLELPPDRPRPLVFASRGGDVTRELPGALSAGMKELAQRTRTTAFMIAFAAFVAVLHRYTGATDVTVGTASSNRRDVALEPLIGFFVNMVPLRTSVSDDLRFGDLIGRCRDTCLAAFDHDELPFEMIVAAVNPPRDAGRTPLFQIEFAFYEFHETGENIEYQGLDIGAEVVRDSGSRFDLSYSLVQGKESITAVVEYNAALYDHDTITRLVESYETLLRAALAEPDSLIGQLPVMSDAERRRVTHTWAKGRRTPVADTNVAEPFARTAAERRDDPAIVSSEGCRTYGECDASSDNIAASLTAAGVRDNDLVGILLPRSPTAVEAILGVLKAGAAYVPLDPGLPPARLSYIAENAGLGFILGHDTIPDWLGDGRQTIMAADCLPVDDAAAARSSRSRCNPAQLAYVLYTSGSTGRPKGVAVSHGAVLNMWAATTNDFAITRDDRVLQFAPLTFDISVFEIFAALLNGATLCMPNAEERLSADQLSAFMAEYEVTVAELPPVLLPLLREEDLSALRLLSVGGEAFSGELVERWRKPHRRFVNGYGPTESTVVVTTMDCVEASATEPPIGRPLDNVDVFVLDSSLEPIPSKAIGELYLAGAGLATYYLNDPRQTAERFLPNPYGEPGTRLYRTGDLARWRVEGTLEFIGRRDRQVKLDGYRIELGEIEAVLLESPNVAQAHACLTEPTTPTMSRRLVAYVAAPAGSEANPSELEDLLKSRLPGYMVPAHIVVLPVFPLTPHGKIDTANLPDPHFTASDGEVEPRTDLERQIATDILAPILGRDRIGIHDNFFVMGGSSLEANQVIQRIREFTGTTISLASFFQHPTVAGLASLVDEAAPADVADPDERLAKALAEVERLSDVEVEESLRRLEIDRT